MSNKFLYPLHDESLSALTNGTATLYLKSLKVNDLQGSRNVATDSAKYLKSDDGGGGGVETTNKPVEENAIVVYDGTTGDNIKFVSGLKYDDVNSRVVVPDIESGAYLSLNSQLQLISNIQSATQSPDIVTNFNGEIHVAKIKSASHNTELEFETDGDAALTADGNISFTALGTGNIELNSSGLNIYCPDTAIRLNNKSVKFVITRIMNTFSGIQAGANINTGDQNTAFGYNSLQSINTGSSNTAIGSQALRGTNTGIGNVAVGDQALIDNTEGRRNIAVGMLALSNNTTEDDNIGVGYGALLNNLTGGRNIAIGTNSLEKNNSGDFNISIGHETLKENLTGNSNTAIGYTSFNNLTAGNFNVGLGYRSGISATSAENSTAIGSMSSESLTTGNNNTSIGAESLKLNQTGGDNVAIGVNALYNNTTSSNIGIGKDCMYNNSTGSNNVAMGLDALRANQTGIRNIAIGTQALYNDVGNDNVGIGHQTLFNNNTGYSNVGIGYQSLLSNIDGINNTAVGWFSGGDNVSGSRNVYIGKAAGANADGGNDNTFIGFETKFSHGQTYNNSTAIGAYSLISASNQIVLGHITVTETVPGADGVQNLGSSSRKFNNIYGTTYHEGASEGFLIKSLPIGLSNTYTDTNNPPSLFAGGDYNTFYGLSSGENAVNANRNTCIGVSTMSRGTSATREFNTIVGHNAGVGETTSTFSDTTLLGTYAGENLTTANGNVFVGARAGRNQTTGADCVYIGKDAAGSGSGFSNSIAIGAGASARASNQCCIGDTNLEKIYNLGDANCDLGSTLRRFKDLHLAGNIYGAAKNSINVSTAGDKDLYNDGTLRIWLDDSTTDDIEIEITTPAGNVTTAKTYHLTSTSFKGTTTSSGAIALAGTATVNYTVDFDFQTDEVMVMRLWSPTLGTAWGFYEITCVNTYSIDFTGQPVLCSVKRLF